MDAYEAIKKRRSIRKYKDEEVPEIVLKRCVNAARLSPCGANLQPLKFITITKELEKIFEHTNWAGYLDWEPTAEEMPRAYIALVKKEDTGWMMDVGMAAQSICLTALNEGLGTCMLGAIDKEGLESILPVPEGYKLKLMIGLGYPAEDAETIEDEKSVEYYYDGETLKVPKKPLEQVWIKF